MDMTSHIYEHLQQSEACRNSCPAECFKVIDHATTKFQVKIKEALHISWEQPSLNKQLYHVNLTLVLINMFYCILPLLPLAILLYSKFIARFLFNLCLALHYEFKCNFKFTSTFNWRWSLYDRNMSCKLKCVVILIKIVACLLLSRCFGNKKKAYCAVLENIHTPFTPPHSHPTLKVTEVFLWFGGLKSPIF